MNLQTGFEVRGGRASLEDTGESELITRYSKRSHFYKALDGFTAKPMVNIGRDERGERNKVWCGNFIEQLTGKGRGVEIRVEQE